MDQHPHAKDAMSALPAAVIFDMDGLLFDSEALYHDAIMAAARGRTMRAPMRLASASPPPSGDRIRLGQERSDFRLQQAFYLSADFLHHPIFRTAVRGQR
ncbi:HAD family hydrolase [Pseudoroseomonas ludipueritiae]|uniref:hypothetical protein n=1 Tax=Pseudoroseomonas ludipueritiae TaxID=198093 RepID=UPI001EEE2ACF|nr:hypothetical protein [Pseudoroseomonas ludipueritiae]